MLASGVAGTQALPRRRIPHRPWRQRKSRGLAAPGRGRDRRTAARAAALVRSRRRRWHDPPAVAPERPTGVQSTVVWHIGPFRPWLPGPDRGPGRPRRAGGDVLETVDVRLAGGRSGRAGASGAGPRNDARHELRRRAVVTRTAAHGCRHADLSGSRIERDALGDRSAAVAVGAVDVAVAVVVDAVEAVLGAGLDAPAASGLSALPAAAAATDGAGRARAAAAADFSGGATGALESTATARRASGPATPLQSAAASRSATPRRSATAARRSAAAACATTASVSTASSAAVRDEINRAARAAGRQGHRRRLLRELGRPRVEGQRDSHLLARRISAGKVDLHTAGAPAPRFQRQRHVQRRAAPHGDGDVDLVGLRVRTEVHVEEQRPRPAALALAASGRQRRQQQRRQHDPVDGRAQRQFPCTVP